MTRLADRLTGRAPPPAREPFATRPFGTTPGQAARLAAAAAAARVPGQKQADGTTLGGRANGATGASGSGTNLTTSTIRAPLAAPGTELQ